MCQQILIRVLSHVPLRLTWRLTTRHRLFWSEDQRFLKQFRAGNLAARFKPFSKFPPCYKARRFTYPWRCRVALS